MRLSEINLSSFETEVLAKVNSPDLGKLWNVEKYLETLGHMVGLGLVEYNPSLPQKPLLTTEGLLALLQNA